MSTATITPSGAVFADAGTRTITGRIIEYGVRGVGSMTATFSAQSLVLPQDVTRVKLYRDHRNQYGMGTPVGWMTKVDNRPDGAYATFQIGVGPDGDQALHDAQGVRDGFSVEVKDVQVSSDRVTVTRALLDGVALVPAPAFAEARVQSVQFSENPTSKEGSTMTDTQPTAPAPAAPATTAPAAPAPANEGQAPVLQPTFAQTAPAPEGGVPRSEPTYDPGHAGVAQFHGTDARPMGITGVADRGPSFSEVAGHLQALMRGESPTAQFALADITSSAFTPDVTPKGWLGELWSGLGYTRKIVPAVTNRALTNYRMIGWRWITKPQVGPYAGDKAEIPTNTPDTEPAEITAKRWAAGWDLDRKFIDFNDGEFVASFLRAAVEDYAKKTDADLATFLNASATAVAGSQPDLLRAVAVGNHQIELNDAGSAGFVLVNSADMISLLDVAQLDVPAFLATLGISPSAWITSPLVPAGSVLVGAKSAVEFYELAGSPVRVNALDLARGGVDHAVFGYTANHLTNAKGLVKVNWAKPVTP